MHTALLTAQCALEQGNAHGDKGVGREGDIRFELVLEGVKAVYRAHHREV